MQYIYIPKYVIQAIHMECSNKNLGSCGSDLQMLDNHSGGFQHQVYGIKLFSFRRSVRRAEISSEWSDANIYQSNALPWLWQDLVPSLGIPETNFISEWQLTSLLPTSQWKDHGAYEELFKSGEAR